MQRIIYSFSVRVENSARNRAFGQAVEQKLYEMPGVENVVRAYFTYDIEIVRPREESGINISFQISDFLLNSFPEIKEAVELDWVRLPPSQ